MLERLAGPFTANSKKFRCSPQIMIVCIQILGGLALGTLKFLALDSRRDRTDDASSDAVLEIEHVFKRTVEMIRPEMRAILCIDELACDSHARSCLAHAPFQHVTDAEIAANLFNVHG